MENLIIDIITTISAVLGTGAAIWQTAIVRETDKRKNEIQYLLAGIGKLSGMKMMKWKQQIQLLEKNDTKYDRQEILNIYYFFRDEINEISVLATALEGAVASGTTATEQIEEKILQKQEKLQRYETEPQNH